MKKQKIIIILLILAIIFSVLISISIGSMKIEILKVLKIMLNKITLGNINFYDLKKNEIAVVWEIRLPRTLCSIIVGMGLSTAGVIFQSVLQNPLADPYTLGVSTGAAFGASVAIFINITYNLFFPVTLLALIFAFFTLITVMTIAQKGGGFVTHNIIISGIIISSIFSSGISFLKVISGENVSAIVFWIMGSLSSKNWNDVLILFPVILTTIVIAFIFSNELNIISLGEKDAQSLGVDTVKLKYLYLIIGSIITAFCVSVCGVIGFIGLIVPHILRKWVSCDNRILIPFSSLFGGLLLCIADNISRIVSNGEIPVGVFTTLLGGPFFIYIFTKGKEDYYF